jgi:hypothetical protein
VSGYGVPDEDSRLDLFLTRYISPPHSEVPTLNASDIDTSFNRLERFLGKALRGLHEELEHALPEPYMAERIHQLSGMTRRTSWPTTTASQLLPKNHFRSTEK